MYDPYGFLLGSPRRPTSTTYCQWGEFLQKCRKLVYEIFVHDTAELAETEMKGSVRLINFLSSECQGRNYLCIKWNLTFIYLYQDGRIQNGGNNCFGSMADAVICRCG